MRDSRSSETRTPFLITIDTEGDDLWSKPRRLTTRNARYLPRFQDLCERFGFKPVYLTNYEMAVDDAFVEFGRDAAARGTAEIGMHLHAWNSPPVVPLTRDDFFYQPFLTEYPENLMREKIAFMTGLLEERFDRPMVSHRSGRIAMDRRYAALLLEHGYQVDCSVTPGIDWRGTRGAPDGHGGTDYTGFPEDCYFLDPADLARPAAEGLLEVPVTIHQSALYRTQRWAYRLPLVRSVVNRVSPGLNWMCPGENGRRGMLRAARGARERHATHVEFMLHSSELMPDGSPGFRRAADIERLYDDLEQVFEELCGWCCGMTLGEFYNHTCSVTAAKETIQ